MIQTYRDFVEADTRAEGKNVLINQIILQINR